MKLAFKTVLAVVVILSGLSCNEKKTLLSKEGEIILKLQLDKTQPDYVREGAGLLLSVLGEQENLDISDYLKAKRKVSSVRSSATVLVWIALLQSTEKKIPDLLPSAEEIDREERESYAKGTNRIYYTNALRLSLLGSCVSALSSLDMPEAKSEVEAFLHRFEKKYGNSSGGKKMLKLYKDERRQQEELVSMGAAPWQVGPNPNAP